MIARNDSETEGKIRQRKRKKDGEEKGMGPRRGGKARACGDHGESVCLISMQAIDNQKKRERRR